MEYYIGPAAEIESKLIAKHPELPEVISRVRTKVPSIKREIWHYQAMALYHLLKPYNRDGCTVLEIGTAYGFSAAVMASATPQAKILTLNPKTDEAVKARGNLVEWPNVQVIEDYSVPWLERAVESGLTFDVIFVDGDHKNIKLDLPYFNLIRTGGLFVHHDYSPEWSPRPCGVVYDQLNAFTEFLGRDIDVLIVDDTDVGMAGWYKLADDPVIDLAKL